ncbi:BMP family ABC transporter substrate-binding protein [Candidatus Allofournierella merdipullorum]|uniref:BMP family ABC transporter substrate-binding protein n=1 Tax=Candidatus Allofournierella merdipullorum TaxID=2838595 RepID=UPI002A8E998B|nr:BMP family ABC transporter substrate-binding protein [Candidatus Fournierella merdipullorum]
MKKLLSILLAGAMVLSLAACGGDTGTSTSEPASASTGTSEPASATGGIPKDEIKVGVIHLSDPAEGSGYTYTHDQGIIGMQQNLGLRDDQIVRKISVDDTDAAAVETAITECVEEGCNIIFATSWGYMDTCEALAEEFPEVIFSHGTGYKSNGTNFNNYFGRIYQARYLSGIIAGLKTESNKIGYVAAMGQENGEVTSGCNAFAMGVASVNPDAEVYVSVTNSWFDPEGEKQAAERLIAEGCDVIGQHCDTPNPQTAAEEHGVWGVGYNSDMTKDAPGATLTSVMWDWSVYYTKAVQNVIDGTWVAGEKVDNYFGDMADGLVTLGEFNSDLVTDEMIAKVEEVKAQIVSGEWDVFDGKTEIMDNEGNAHTLEGADYGSCNWYYENVNVL